MGIKFPVRRPEAGEIAHPDDINLNLKEFVDEINGNLDSDNFENTLGSGIDKSCFSVGSFTESFQDGHGTLNFECSHNTTGFISKDDSGTEMPIVEFTAESDGWIIVDFSAYHHWEGNGFTSKSEAQVYMTVEWPHFLPWIGRASASDILGNLHHYPPGGWLGVSGSRTLKGTKELELHSRLVEDYEFRADEDSGRKFYHMFFPQGRWVAKPIDRYAIQYKVEVNGNDIAETGWLFNGNQHQGAYLCGCIPVVAGKNKIVASVRAVSHFDLKASPRGTGNSKGAEYVPRQTTVTMDGLSPLPKRKNIGGGFFGPGATSLGQTENFIGIDCTVRSANLVVQYRKA